jgi:PTS system cellobiose-specific IIB component
MGRGTMKIILVCSAGMSTSLLVEAMRRAAAEQGREADIGSASAEQLPDLLPADVVLVAPQIRHRFAQISQAAAAAGVPAVLLDQRAYGLVDGAAALAQALEAQAAPPAG